MRRPSPKPPVKRKRQRQARPRKKARPLRYNWLEKIPTEVVHIIASFMEAGDIAALLRTCSAAHSRVPRSLLYRASVLQMEAGIVKAWYREVLSRIIFYLDEFDFTGAMRGFFAAIYNGDLHQVQGFLGAKIGSDFVGSMAKNWMPRPRRLVSNRRIMPVRSCMMVRTAIPRTVATWSPDGFVIYPEVHQSDDNERIFTPLHLAVWCGWEDVVEALVRSGANVDSLDGQGLCSCHPRVSPLHLARCTGRTSILMILQSTAIPDAPEHGQYVIIDGAWFESPLGAFVSGTHMVKEITNLS